MKIDSPKLPLPLAALLLALLPGGLYVSTLVAQNQSPIVEAAPGEPPASDAPADEASAGTDEQVEVVIPDTGGALRRQLDLLLPSDRTPVDGVPASRSLPGRSRSEYIPSARAEPVPANPFAGKVVLLETFDTVYPPYEDVQIQTFAGHSFFVVDGIENGQPTYQLWLAVGSVQSVRLFDRMRDAEQFLRTGRVGR